MLELKNIADVIVGKRYINAVADGRTKRVNKAVQLKPEVVLELRDLEEIVSHIPIPLSPPHSRADGYYNATIFAREILLLEGVWWGELK